LTTTAVACSSAPSSDIVDLREWQRWSSRATGIAFAPSPADEALSLSLSDAGTIAIDFLRSETRIVARSHVGTIRLGGVTIRVRPKIEGAPLLRLVRYAYGLGDLKLYDALNHSAAVDGLLELLLAQFAAEVELLIRGGLRNGYVRAEMSLAAPRGRIDLRKLATRAPTDPTLPCVLFPRSLDTRLHQVLKAGLDLAAGLAGDRALRLKLQRLRDSLEGVLPIRIDAARIQETITALDRTTTAYGTALRLLELVMAGLGLAQTDRRPDVSGRGFLFDMNRFFQSLLSRVLQENDAGLVVRDEQRLGTLMRYAPGTVDAGRLPPVPRPDFAVVRGGQVVGLFDAKYRDLSEGSPPREMLYQLALYAQSREGQGISTMLYPSTSPRTDRVIEVLDPTATAVRARVVIRAVDLVRLADLVSSGADRALRAAFATGLLRPLKS
jgi:5-methylcytosine-specific restriction enzyme subunit McrC